MRISAKHLATAAMALLLSLGARQSLAQPLPPDAPANVRSIMAKMQRGGVPTRAEMNIVASYFRAKNAATPGRRPPSSGRSGPPNMDAVKGIPCVVNLTVNGSFKIVNDTVRSGGQWTLRGSFPCRLKVSDQGGRETISPDMLAMARSAAAAQGQRLPDMRRIPKRIPELSSFPLKDSTASFHFVSDPDNAAHAGRYVRVDATASSTGHPRSGSLQVHGSYTPNPMSGFDMTLTNFNRKDPMFAFALMAGGSTGGGFTASRSPDDAVVDMYGGIMDPMPDETAQMPDLVKTDMATPKPSMKWSTRALQAAVNSGQSTTISGTENFRQHTESGSGLMDATGTSTISITLRPKPVELLVQIENYDNWVPTADKDEDTRGNQLKVHATLKTTDGHPPGSGQLASRIRFELPTVSKQPGVSLNWPKEGKTTPDLKFDRTDPGNVTVTSDTGAERIDAEGHHYTVASADANIGSYDWGAYGELKVTAEMPDGRVLEGKLTGHDDPQILLPKRKADSYISDKWKSQNGVSGGDSDDKESSKGNSHDGDGFTLYEEYRGIMAKGAHEYLSPKKKDLIVLNKIGDLADPGIDLFASAAEVKVHKVDATELNAETRVVNCNHSTTFQGEQHGLIIESGNVADIPASTPGGMAGGETMGDGLASVVPPNAIPNRRLKDTKKIMVDLTGWRSQIPATATEAEMPDLVAENKRSLNVAIAHEMGHAAGLLHHGKKGAADVTIYPGDHETAYDIHGALITPTAAGIKVKNVGPQDSPASGDADCIMCYTDTYDWAQLPPLPGQSSLAYRFYKVPHIGFGVQTKFCVDGTGTEINESGHEPVSYFGDAKNGGCLGKIYIKDY